MAETAKKTNAERQKEYRAKKKAAAAQAATETKAAKAETADIPSEGTAVPTAQPKTVDASEPKVQLVSVKEPMVKMLYIDSAIDNNQIPIGHGRYVTGSGRVFSVTLSDFEGEFMTPLTMMLLKKRKFIVLDGLDDDQRAQYNCLYSEGEVVKSEGIFDAFLNWPISEAKEKYEQLCPEHRELVARRIISAWDAHDNRVSRARLEALNEVSKKDFADNTGAFSQIIHEMNEQSI